MTNYLREPHRKPITDWMLAHGFIFDDERGVMAITWSTRSGYDFTDLEFYPLARHAEDQGWDAIVGHHASGTNPRMVIGCCEQLSDVAMVFDTIRRINGYKEPEAVRLDHCPTCDSPEPRLHPAVQFEGEVQECRNEWHKEKP